MTILSDFLRDNQGTVVRIYPDASGELLVVTPNQFDDGWSDASYTIPTEGYEYRTLADSDGNTWYAYVVRVQADGETHHEIQISSAAPTSQPAGIWREPKYGAALVATAADVGSEIYLAFEDLSGTDWYVYPTNEGELKITTVQPS
jgi:hypothetical protein